MSATAMARKWNFLNEQNKSSSIFCQISHFHTILFEINPDFEFYAILYAENKLEVVVVR